MLLCLVFSINLVNVMRLKERVAEAALAFVPEYAILGVGTGSTVDCLIQHLPRIRHRIQACVASSVRTALALRALSFPVVPLASVDALTLYLDGADEVLPNKTLMKGGGGALTREKILAMSTSQFIVMVDHTKLVPHFGAFPLPVEVLTCAIPLVKRYFEQHPKVTVKLREHDVTDNGQSILDVSGLDFHNPLAIELEIKQWPGVVESGLFIRRPADRVLVAYPSGEIESF